VGALSGSTGLLLVVAGAETAMGALGLLASHACHKNISTRESATKRKSRRLSIIGGNLKCVGFFLERDQSRLGATDGNATTVLT